MHKINILTKLEASKPFFSQSETKIYEFVLANIERIPNMIISEFAAQCDTSEATIIRFARKIGFKGYSDFKIAISSSLPGLNQHQELIKDMDVSDNPIMIFEKLINYTKTSLDATLNSMDQGSLNEAVELIDSANKYKKRIFLVGAGASGNLALQFRIKLMRLNIDSVFYEDSHLQLEVMSSITEGDLLICFTTLGKSQSTLDAIELANRNKAKVILMTQFGNHSLEQKVDVTLFISNVESNFRLASQTSITVQSLIVDTLFLALAFKDYEQIKNNVDKSKKVFDEFGYYRKL